MKTLVNQAPGLTSAWTSVKATNIRKKLAEHQNTHMPSTVPNKGVAAIGITSAQHNLAAAESLSHRVKCVIWAVTREPG